MHTYYEVYSLVFNRYKIFHLHYNNSWDQQKERYVFDEVFSTAKTEWEGGGKENIRKKILSYI